MSRKKESDLKQRLHALFQHHVWEGFNILDQFYEAMGAGMSVERAEKETLCAVQMKNRLRRLKVDVDLVLADFYRCKPNASDLERFVPDHIWDYLEIRANASMAMLENFAISLRKKYGLDEADT